MKDDIFILHQPTHSVLSIILVNTDFPLTESSHNKISNLVEFSDVFFIFPEKSRSIRKDKFTSLYEGCGWVESGQSLCETYLKTLLYSLEIFEKHVGFCLYNLSDLDDFNIEVNKNKILELTASSVGSPIFKTRRLGSNEFYEIYKKSNSGIFSKVSDSENMYCSYTSDSKLLYFKRSVAGLYVNFWQSSENNKYIKSFSISDPRYFFASMTKFLTIGTIDSEVEDLNIGTLG